MKRPGGDHVNWLRRFASIRISFAELAVIWVGVKIGIWAEERCVTAIRGQDLLFGFGWFVFAIAAPLAGIIVAVRWARRVREREHRP